MSDLPHLPYPDPAVVSVDPILNIFLVKYETMVSYDSLHQRNSTRTINAYEVIPRFKVQTFRVDKHDATLIPKTKSTSWHQVSGRCRLRTEAEQREQKHQISNT